MIRRESSHGTLHLYDFRNDVKGSTCLDSTNGDDCGAEGRGFTADQCLQRCNNVCRNHDRVNCAMWHSSMSTFAFHTQNKLVGTGKDCPCTHSDVPKGIIADQVQTDDTVHTLHGTFFDHWLSPTDCFFSRLKDKFHISRQFCPAFAE